MAICAALAPARSMAVGGDGAGFSAWSRGVHSAARLIAAGPSADGGAARRAGIEIRLDPGFLTYWRQPGEAGLPPTIDTARSDNIAGVAVDFPAPGTFDEGGVPLFGYRDDVVLPLRLTLTDPARPATLAVDLDYAVCADICLPGKASMRIALPASGDDGAAQILAQAEAAVPRRTTLGAPGALAITGVTPVAGGPKPGLSVAARAGVDAALYVEAPDGWFLVPGAAKPGTPGTIVFPVAVTQAPSGGDKGPLDLRLTLVDGSASIDVPVRVDAGPLTP